MATLTARRLAKRYRSRLVVNDVSLTVRSGEIVGLLGPNGAGKTTSFYMIIGLVACDTGIVQVDHDDLSDSPMHLRARAGLGYLPQEPSIFRHLSVRDNVMAILETRPGMSRDEREHRLETLLDEFQVTRIADQRGDSLSGGERRRVEIARALASDPRFMLLDEPFAGVDPISIVEIQQIIGHLSERGIGILITDHNVRDTLRICDRAYIVNQGTIIAKGAPEDVLGNERVREVYLGRNFRL
ncbi:MAG: LPS export ABC transporter ATP-binding protein [Thiotrichales bacterium]|nr:LPS export ABC transporter ATP-binding protein [Thiotrichales bacterium]MCY4283765.1 LPS export ABC transporter ATP-binding protein [Thiotrichales bacterium]MCY4348532.1 LPS export ABC transporter ATP-binding protein [Thiotrichales bacterium]